MSRGPQNLENKKSISNRSSSVVSKQSSQVGRAHSHSKSSFSTFQDDGEEVDVFVDIEDCSILMALDNTKTGLYVLYYYLKKIHKPQNFIHACFVSDDFISARTHIKSKTDKQEDEEKKKKSCCKLLHHKTMDVVDVGPSPGVLAELRKIDRVACLKVKHRVKHLLNKNGVNWDFRRLRGADPGKAILDYRKSIGADIIVMGSRGSSKGHLGSVATKVMHQSSVPVLVVRRPSGAMETITADKESSIG